MNRQAAVIVTMRQEFPGRNRWGNGLFLIPCPMVDFKHLAGRSLRTAKPCAHSTVRRAVSPESRRKTSCESLDICGLYCKLTCFHDLEQLHKGLIP